jgi:glycosyltransferase involved in cell wall biosynthesis
MLRVASRRLPSAMLATSEAVRTAFKRAVGSAPPIITVYNPVDLGGFHPGLARDRLRRSLGLANDVPIVGLVAHLTPWKGHDIFLDIASALADSPQRPHFVVAGGPVYETDGHAGYADVLRQRAAARGVSDRVTFLGARDDIADVLAGLDVLVHTPTAPEPFGRVLAEAMAVGRPVVAARCGGIPEVVEDRVTGLLVTPGDAAGFRSAVARLLDDAELRSDLGRAGRARAAERFGCDEYVTKIVGVYRDMILRRRGGA